MIGIRAALASVILLMLLNLSIASATTTVTFQPGAYIIDMGSFPYTYATGIKPYGLIYDLVINKQIPVSWAINPGKAKDGIDFTVPSGTGAGSYRGGSFIVPQDYASDALATINTWKAKGVIVKGPTTANFTAPIYDNITSFPNAVCDLQNGAIIIKAFYTPSEVPSSSYRLGSPSNLNPCDDLYAMPHADPQDWDLSEQTTFSNFINGGGCLWAGCHAVSALEADTPDYLGYYYLSQNGLIPWGDHDGADPPYSYNASSADDPIMQFIGKVDNALSSGSEQVYIPDTTPSGNNWRGSTTVAVWDPLQSDVYPSRPGILAAKIAYGYAYGNSSKGFILYESSHSFLSGNTSENVDAARVYGNFLLECGIMKRPEITAYVPSEMLSGSGATVNVSVTMGTGTPPFTYKWTSSCGGSFANPFAASTTFTAPTVTAVTPCIIRVTVTDSCGRRNFESRPVTIYPVMMTLQKTDYKTSVQPDELLNYRIYYNNTGPITADNVVITDLLPTQLIYNPIAYPVPLSVTPNINGTTTLVWNLGNVPAGGKRVILLNATVKSSVTSGEIIDNVRSSCTLLGQGPVIKTARDIDVVVPITKYVNKSTAVAGDYLNYSMCVRYDGLLLLENATVKDTIPDYTTYVTNSSNAGGTYYPGNRTLIWDLGSNEPGVTSRTFPGTNIVNIPAIYDMYVTVDNPLRNYGIAQTLLISQNDERAFLYFPMSVIPPSSTINSATFNAFVTTKQDAATISIRGLLRDWCLQADQCVQPCNGLIDEGVYNGAEPAGTTGYGSNWNSYLYKKTYLNCPWTTAGGDYDTITFFGSFAASAGAKNVPITSLVQGWYSGTYVNQGILLESNGNNDAAIGSKNHGTAANRPQLQITYQVGVNPPVTVTVNAQTDVFDTYLDQQKPLDNYGTTTTLGLRTGGGQTRRALIYFKLPTLPGGAVINSANLLVFVTNAQATSTITVRRSIRSWCTNVIGIQATGCYNLCQNKVVEGRLNGNEPDTLAEGYGTVWTNYYYNKNSVACPWTTAGGDFSATQYGSFAGTAGAKSADITSLVQGWYLGSIANQGIALRSLNVNNAAAIASRESTTVANRPYIQVNYTVGQGTNISISARPLLSCQGGQIVVNVSANSSSFMGSITAPVLSINAFNASVSLASGPTPASYANVPALQNCYFTYVYNVNAGAYPGSITFSGKPATPSYFATATSNKLLITPLLSYAVRINQTTPDTVTKINNTANFIDQNIFTTPGAVSNLVTTNLIWPINIQVTKTGNISQGVKCNNVAFSLVVKNTGIAALQTVEVVDTLPLGLEYVSSFNGSANGQIITWANIGPLSKGQSKTLTLVAHISGDAFGFLNNLVSVKGTTSDDRNVTNSSSFQVQALKTDISGTKTPDKLEGPPSTNINFTMVISNTGQSPLSPAWLLDILPEGLNYVSATPAPGYIDLVNQKFIWTFPSLAAGASQTVVLKAHINGEYYGSICNPIVVTGKTISGLNVTNNSYGCVYAQEPKINVTKQVAATQGSPSTNVNFTINVTNTGEAILNPVKVVDTLPYGLNYVSSYPAGASAAGNTVTWNNIGTLNVGQSRLVYILAHINGSRFGLLKNLVNATGTTSSGGKVWDIDNASVQAFRPAISIVKTANLSEGAPCTRINFTLQVSNTGNVTLSPVQVVDTLPTGLNYISSGNGSALGNIVTWSNIGSMTPGQSKQLWMVGHIDGAAYGNLNNTVQVTGTPPTGNPVKANASLIVVAKRASIDVQKTGNISSGPIGSYVNYTLKVTNTGEVVLDPVKVVDTMDYGLAYISSNGTAAGNVITWSNIGPMAPGQSKSLYLIAQLNGSQSGPLHNNVDVTGTPPTGNPVTDNDLFTVTAISAAGDITIIKDANLTQAVYNQRINFTIEVVNSGTDNLNTVQVVDVLPTGLTYQNDDRGGVNVGQTITWSNVGPLTSGSSTFIHLIAYVDGDQFGLLTNHVNTTGITVNSQTVTDNTTEVVEALYNPDVVISKIALNDTVEPGENAIFIIKASNPGNVPLPTVKVVDVLPIGLVYVSDNSTPPAAVSGNLVTWNNVGPLAAGASKFIQLVAKVQL